MNLLDAPLSASGPAPPPANRFQCAVNMQCVDPDLSNTDDYTCTCPACNDVALSATTVGLLQGYFNTHPAISRYVASGVVATLANEAGGSTCRDPARTGCMTADALGYDPTAAIHDDSMCTARVFGCMDPRAVNYHSDANSPGSITTDGTGCTATGCTDVDDGLCRSAFCATAAACVSIFSGNSEGACAGADISSADIKVAQDNCEAAGIDAGDTRHEHVCRYVPAQRELCPYTDSNGAHVSSCTCDGGGASSLFDEDECATEVYDGVSHDACDSAAFRLCSDFDGPGPDEGWPGRHCTAYRCLAPPPPRPPLSRAFAFL